MQDSVLCEIDDGVARITLNRPEALNAFDEGMAHAWAEVVTETVSDERVRAIMLAGNGRAFCAGGDVRAMADAGFDGEHIAALAHLINRGQLALIESSIPVVAAAHGTTAGGGLGILLNSDYAVVGHSSKVGSLYAKLGLTPDLTVTALLARAIGERRALQLVLQDRLVTASEAVSWGLVAEAVPDDEVLDRAKSIARYIADNSPESRGTAKRMIRASFTRSLTQTLNDEALSIGAALSSENAKARINAFIRG